MAYQEKNRTVLTNVPLQPPDFFNISTQFIPGHYLFGNNKFRALHFHLVSIFRREFGQGDEFILSILSVFLIGFLSELVYTFLLRRRGQISVPDINAASAVDDLIHVRQMLHFVSNTVRGRRSEAAPTSRRNPITFSIVIVAVAAILFLAEAASVFLTQPTETVSGRYQYNLRAVQPTGTALGMAKFIRRESRNNGCISPIVTKSRQTRQYLISACFKYGEVVAMTNATQVVKKVTVRSFYHKAGSDHEVSFGKGRHTLSMRARIFLSTKDLTSARRLLFTNLDNSNMSHAKYLQDRTIYGAMEWSCNQDYSRQNCSEIQDAYRVVSTGPVIEDILLWDGRKKEFRENVTGLETTYAVPIHAPFTATSVGMSALSSSAAILEVEGPGKYSTVREDKEEDGIPALLIESGRVAGVLLFAMVVAVLLIALLAATFWLKPTSLAEVAMMGARGKDEQFDHSESEAVSYDEMVP